MRTRVCGRETNGDGGGERGWGALRRCVGGVWLVWERWLVVWVRTGENFGWEVTVQVELEQRGRRVRCVGWISALEHDGVFKLGVEVAGDMVY